MRIRIYNENGNIKITQQMTEYTTEDTIFTSLNDGEVVEINVTSDNLLVSQTKTTV